MKLNISVCLVVMAVAMSASFFVGMAFVHEYDVVPLLAKLATKKSAAEKPAKPVNQDTYATWLANRIGGFGFRESHQQYVDVVDACQDNDCWRTDYLALLLAIRKAENGGPGIEYGIVCKRGSTYRVQAGWCAATISKYFNGSAITPERIDKFSVKYCPPNHDIWAYNVKYWYDLIYRSLRDDGKIH